MRIAITGPESTGKSTLARQLAEHYQTAWVPEYARKYIQDLERPYEQEDLLNIAKGQMDHEDEMARLANKLLFCDTELNVIRIWSEYKYEQVDPIIVREYERRTYDLYLLMNIDLPWEYDPLREHPEERKFFFDWFDRALMAKHANYHIISGSYEKRLKMACGIVDELIITKLS